MKTVLYLLLALMMIGAGNLSAQTDENIQAIEQSIRKDGQFAIMAMKAQHFKTAVATGIDFKSNSKDIDFQVVACGELVKEISQDQALQSLIKEAAAQHGLKFLVCGLSIAQLKVDKALLPKEVSVTKNGMIYMFGLQEKGYNTLVL